MSLTASKSSERRKGSDSLSHQAYRQLKTMILSNELQGGRYLLENEICEIIGMSRTPVRSALERLEGEGLIEIIPRRGIRILTLTLDDLFEIYSILEAIEALAIRTVFRNGQHEVLGSELLEIVDRMDAALDRDDLESWAREYTEFHQAIVTHTGMKRLEKLSQNLLDQSCRVRFITLRLRDRPIPVNINQRALAQAILDGDLDTALRQNETNHRNRLHEIRHIFEKFALREL